MATTKKTNTTKKTPVTKKKTTKSVSTKGPKKAAKLTWRFYVVTIGIFLIAVSTVIVLAYLTAGIVARQTNQARLDRINEIYASLNLNDSYQVERSNVFGDKRPYEYDEGRTFSSEIDYSHGDTVSNTVAELDTKIKAVGFTFAGEPYPGGRSVQYHYKSADGEYIRLTVESKPYWDAIRNSALMDQEIPAAVFSMDTNAGPSKVIIKVNLDDNNE